MEEWKDRIMNSLEGIQRAEVPHVLFHKIQDKITEKKLTAKQWWATAAAVTLLVSFNILVVSSYQNQTDITTSKQGYTELVSNYNIYGNE